MSPSSAAVPKRGRISVVTDPAGARVSVDGQARGVSPVTIVDLEEGPHSVTVAAESGSAERSVALEAGATASVMFSLPKSSASVGGWLAIDAPFEVQVLERTDVIGAPGTTKIMVPAGRHELTLVSNALGYRENRKVEVTPGKTTSVRVNPPKAALSLNARPWADVVIDGSSAGQTPIANMDIAVGTHQVVFRHPQFGERRQSVVVTVQGPNRIAVDFTKSN